MSCGASVYRLQSLRLLTCLAVLGHALDVQAAPRAFPGAEGFGAMVSGGRGGTVVHVTNLNDSGAGSLRDALSAGDRIVVFDVAGLITIASQLVVKGDNVTVAGQTAPSPGITVYGDGTSVSGRNNVILRYLRFRQGYDSASGTKALNVTDGSNMIFDHLSVQWGRWDTIGITGKSSSITVQHSLLGESIDPQRFGGLIDSADKVTISHNLWLDNQSRSPKLKANGQYINNVVYNWGANGLGGGHSGADWYQDLLNNYFIKGPSSTGGFATGFASTDRVFHRGNLADLDANGTLGGRAVTDADFQGDTPPTFESAAHNAPPVPVTVESASDAYASVLASAGASLCRDAVDQRLVGHVMSLGSKGAIVDDESLVGGQPTIAATSRPANFDNDRDGMADEWESAHGLNPASESDAAADADGDGYDNLDDYLNDLASAAPDSCGAAPPAGGDGAGGGAGASGRAGSGGQSASGSAGSGNAVGGNAVGGNAAGGNAQSGSAAAGSSATSNTAGLASSAGAAMNGGRNDAGTSNAESSAPIVDESGCGCRVGAAPVRSGPTACLLALAGVWSCLRRRAARGAGTPAR
jgi:pectate lyase